MIAMVFFIGIPVCPWPGPEVAIRRHALPKLLIPVSMPLLLCTSTNCFPTAGFTRPNRLLHSSSPLALDFLGWNDRLSVTMPSFDARRLEEVEFYDSSIHPVRLIFQDWNEEILRAQTHVPIQSSPSGIFCLRYPVIFQRQFPCRRGMVSLQRGIRGRMKIGWPDGGER